MVPKRNIDYYLDALDRIYKLEERLGTLENKQGKLILSKPNSKQTFFLLSVIAACSAIVLSLSFATDRYIQLLKIDEIRKVEFKEWQAPVDFKFNIPLKTIDEL